MKNEKTKILEGLLDDVRETAIDNGKEKELADMFLYKSIKNQMKQMSYIESDLLFGYLCAEIGMLQGKLEYENI